MRVTREHPAGLHDARVHIDDSFIGADLHDDGDMPRSLDDACQRVEQFTIGRRHAALGHQELPQRARRDVWIR